VTDFSDQGIITTNYQWLPENYIINRLLPVPFSKVYDNFALVLDIASVFCVSKFPRCVFIVFIHVHMLTEWAKKVGYDYNSVKS